MTPATRCWTCSGPSYALSGPCPGTKCVRTVDLLMVRFNYLPYVIKRQRGSRKMSGETAVDPKRRRLWRRWQTSLTPQFPKTVRNKRKNIFTNKYTYIQDTQFTNTYIHTAKNITLPWQSGKRADICPAVGQNKLKINIIIISPSYSVSLLSSY